MERLFTAMDLGCLATGSMGFSSRLITRSKLTQRGLAGVSSIRRPGDHAFPGAEDEQYGVSNVWLGCVGSQAGGVQQCRAMVDVTEDVVLLCASLSRQRRWRRCRRSSLGHMIGRGKTPPLPPGPATARLDLASGDKDTPVLKSVHNAYHSRSISAARRPISVLSIDSHRSPHFPQRFLATAA
jgi:hypothetical protein